MSSRDLTINKAIRICLTQKLSVFEFLTIYNLYNGTKNDLLGKALSDAMVRCNDEEEVQEINAIEDAIKAELEVEVEETQTNKR